MELYSFGLQGEWKVITWLLQVCCSLGFIEVTAHSDRPRQSIMHSVCSAHSLGVLILSWLGFSHMLSLRLVRKDT